mmetsp:Transcript_15947/g.42145  ORF Transcript_15947/g.42145 Transcript_15947/m.42145 type:complete len:289 (-) Transcript_15947:2688-3554(-)
MRLPPTRGGGCSPEGDVRGGPHRTELLSQSTVFLKVPLELRGRASSGLACRIVEFSDVERFSNGIGASLLLDLLEGPYYQGPGEVRTVRRQRLQDGRVEVLPARQQQPAEQRVEEDVGLRHVDQQVLEALRELSEAVLEDVPGEAPALQELDHGVGDGLLLQGVVEAELENPFGALLHLLRARRRLAPISLELVTVLLVGVVAEHLLHVCLVERRLRLPLGLSTWPRILELVDIRWSHTGHLGREVDVRGTLALALAALLLQGVFSDLLLRLRLLPVELLLPQVASQV